MKTAQHSSARVPRPPASPGMPAGNQSPPSNARLIRVPAALGFGLALYGVTVVVGWHLEAWILVRSAVGLSPIQFNTAVWVLLCGTALGLLGFRKRPAALALGALVAGFALATCAEYAVGRSFGIDQWLMTKVAPGTEHVQFPGRPSLMASVLFVLTGWALCMVGSRRPTLRRIVWGLCAITLALCAMALVGVLVGLSGTYAWGNSITIAFQTTLALAILNTGILVVARDEALEAGDSFERWVPVPLGLAVVSATLILWQALLAEQRRQLTQVTQEAADSLRTQIGEVLDARLRALERMGRRWNSQGGTSREQWTDDASAYVTDEKIFQAVAWVDSSLKVRWIVPTGGNSGADVADFAVDPELARALSASRERRRSHITPAGVLPQGGKGFIAFVPLYAREQFSGFIAGMIRFEPTFDRIAAEITRANYSLSVFDGADPLYGNGRAEDVPVRPYGSSVLAFHGNQWRLVLELSEDGVARETNNLPHLVLLLGLGLAGVIVAAANSAREARARSAIVEKLNADFGREIAARTQTEIRLRQSEEQFRQSFDFAGIGMALVSLEGQWLRVNRALCDLLGYTEAELLKKTFQDITHPEDLEKDLAQVRALLAGTRSHYQMEKRYYRKDGAVVWIRLTASLVSTAGSKPLHFVSQIENITERRIAEEALRESAARLQLATEAAGLAVWDWNVVTNTVTWDAGMFRIYGISPTRDGQVEYKTWRDAVLPEEIAEQEARLQATLAARGRGQRDFRIRRAGDGAVRTISAAEIGIKDEAGQAARMIGINLDVTERHRIEAALRESEERTRLFAQHAPAAVAMFDLEMRYLVVSAQWLRDYGLEGQDVIGRSHYDVFPEIPERWKEIHRRCLAGAVEKSDADPFERANGRRMWLRWEDRPWFRADGSIGGIVMFTADITELKELQQQLEERNAALEIETRRAQEASRLKSEFLANMSHELRTPLNGIIGFSTFLAGEKPGLLNPKQKEYLGDVLRSGRHLLRLINDLLDLAKIEAGKVDLAPEAFSLRECIAEVSGVLRPLLVEKKLNCSEVIELVDDRVTLDGQKIKQVLYNLLSNAIKFTSEGGQIAIQVAAAGDERIAVVIRDTGIGIKPEDLGRLFVEFQQLDGGSTRRFQGTGLGLALTKKLVALHGGTIHVASEFGRGTTFTVHLPRRIAAPAA